jgi:hypothetical protein
VTGVLDAALPAPLAPPPFARLGLWPLIVLVGATGLVIAAIEFRARRGARQVTNSAKPATTSSEQARP